MVREPESHKIMRSRKLALLYKIKAQVKEKSLVADIKELVGEGFTLKALLRQALHMSQIADPVEVGKIRKRLALVAPEALTNFDELINVSNEYERLKSTLIVY